MCCVAFWFTRRVDSFRGFVGNPKRDEPWVNPLDGRERRIETNKCMQPKLFYPAYQKEYR
jgi:hypothetical protein